MVEIYKEFTFDAAHFLPQVPEGHKCKRMHGHTYHLMVHFRGPIDPQLGWLVDFGDIKHIVKPLVDGLDHQVLNEIPGLENPTAELIAKWFWDQIKPVLPMLHKVELKETPTSGVIYRGE
jgi:6-pyruvoyltetrahydropterin/6-carboxytetrahydropterin synthase